LQLLGQIKQLDVEADLEGLKEEGWAFRYHLDDQLINVYKLDEEYWRQRGRVHGLSKGMQTPRISMLLPTGVEGSV
jgi:hypothetical protein